MDKATLRRELLSRRQALSEPRRRAAEDAILQRLLSRPEWKRSRTVALYYPVRGEVSLLGLFEHAEGRVLLLPRVEGSELSFCRVNSLQELVPGAYGIPSPPCEAASWSPQDIDLFIVPGVGYSERGHRIGYGGGYYDRVLAKKGNWQMAVGVAFSCQVLPGIPVEPWDRGVDLVLTEERVIFPATAVWI